MPGTDFTLIGGKTVLLKSQTDSVYCEMTNTTFPDFNGGNVLKTTCTRVIGNVGIKENPDAPGYQIYTRNKIIHIDAPTNGLVSVYDISGRLVAAKEIIVGDNTIAVQKGGVYLVRLNGSHTPVAKKVFIGN